MKKTLIIIPTYDEKENVRSIAEHVFKACEEANILFVDDNSPDGTGQICDGMAELDQRINVLHRPGKQGLGRAYIAGFKWALEHGYEYIFEMDADFSHNPADIPKMITAADGGADLVLGSRYVGGIRVINWPLSRLILSKGAAVYVHIITGMPFTDPTGGFKCYRSSVLRNIDLDSICSSGYSFQIETIHRAWINGFSVVEVPITFEERRSGHSKMCTNIVFEALWLTWKILAKNGFRRTPRSNGARNPATTRLKI